MMTFKIFYIVNVDWFFLSHRLALALAMKRKGYEVYVLANDTGKGKLIENHGLHFININFERAGKNPFTEVLCISKIFVNIKKHKPAIIHNVTIKPALYGSLAAKLTRRHELKIVNAISGLGYNFIDGRKGFIQDVLRTLMSLVFRKGVNFIFQNPDDMMLYQEMGYLDNNKHKLIKGAGVDSNDYQYHKPIEKSRLHVVLTARMLKDKGVVEFTKAAQLLKAEWSSRVLFRLIGDLDISNPAALSETELRALEIPDYIVWEGFKQDIRSVLIDSDIVCLPSYREGLPRSLIEAMAIGRPIVTTDVPGCRECVQENYNGLLVSSRNGEELARALEILLLDADLRLTMGENSRRKMEEELSLDKVLVDTLHFYNEI